MGQLDRIPEILTEGRGGGGGGLSSVSITLRGEGSVVVILLVASYYRKTFSHDLCRTFSSTGSRRGAYDVVKPTALRRQFKSQQLGLHYEEIRRQSFCTNVRGKNKHEKEEGNLIME